MAGVAKWLRQWIVVPPFGGSSPLVRPQQILIKRRQGRLSAAAEASRSAECRATNSIADMLKEVRVIRILAISGSLRTASSNTALLRAATTLAPEGVEITVYGGLGDLPHFNPDLEGAEPPSIMDFRAQLQMSDGVLISSPEYAHGVPGVLKNALDWVVGSGELVAKPVALLNASPRATHAQASLTETIATMDARIVASASLTVQLPSNKIDEIGIVSHPEISRVLHAAIVAFARAIETFRAEAPLLSVKYFPDEL